MDLDIEKYRHYVTGFDLSHDEQAKLIRSVWMVLESFVDQAYGRHPHQHCRPTLEFKDLQDPLDLLESKTNYLSDERHFPKLDP